MSDCHTCTICGTPFEPHFRYQIEERSKPTSDGGTERCVVYFCSQRCLEASYHERSDGTVVCSACATSFEVQLASQVLFTGGRRHYACGPECRSRVVAGVRSIRLGQLMDPTYVPGEDSATPLHEACPDSGPRECGEAAAIVAEPAQTFAVHQPATHTLPFDEAATVPTEHYRPTGARVVAIFNHKGGSGKTTTAVSLAAGLAARGRRVLLIDTDGQGNVAVSLGIPVRRSLYHVLVMGLPVRDAVVATRHGLHVLPSNETLAAAELYLAGRRQRDRVLATRLAEARELYDYVIVDCSPSLSLMNQNALCMSDALICPVACDYLSLIGVRQVIRTIRNVNKLLEHPIELWGVLPTQFDARARICHEALETLRGHFGERCLDPIRTNIRVKEAPSQGKTLFEYAPGCNAAADYLKVVDRLLTDALDKDCAQPLTAEGGLG